MTNPLRRSTPEALAEFEEISPTKLIARLQKIRLAFLEPTTTFADSFKKKKHKIPNIKTSRQEQPTSRFNTKTPLIKEVPFGRKPTRREAEKDVVARENISAAEKFMPTRFKVRLEKPTQADRTRIIKARLEKLALIKPEDRKQKLQDFKQTKQFVENAGEGDEFQNVDRRKQEEEFIGTGRRIRPTGSSMETSRNLRKLHSKLEKLAIVRIPRKEHRESRATRINFVQNFVEKSRDTVKGKNIVPESKALEKFLNKGELINFKEPGARKIDRDVRVKGAVRIRSLGKPPPPIRDEMGELIPKNKRQLAQIKKQQTRIRKELGIGAKGIYCTPCTKKAMQVIKLKIARFRNTPADEIVGKFEKFINKTPSIKGVNGVFDPDTNRILDANDPNDSRLLQKKFGRGKDKIGFNSVTDTRKGPESNIVLIRNQLRKIEKQGGTPALGFDEGSLEAVDVARGRTDADILGKLESSQRSTGVLTPNKKFKIVDNPNFNM